MRATNRANLFASSARCPRKDKPPRPEEIGMRNEKPGAVTPGGSTNIFLALLWQILAIDRRDWIPESDFQ
jgi:hypothetical protein